MLCILDFMTVALICLPSFPICSSLFDSRFRSTICISTRRSRELFDKEINSSSIILQALPIYSPHYLCKPYSRSKPASEGPKQPLQLSHQETHWTPSQPLNLASNFVESSRMRSMEALLNLPDFIPDPRSYGWGYISYICHQTGL